MSVSTLLQVAHVLDRPVLTLIPGALSHPGLQTVVQVLERRPDLLARVLDVIEVSLQSEREENFDAC